MSGETLVGSVEGRVSSYVNPGGWDARDLEQTRGVPLTRQVTEEQPDGRPGIRGVSVDVNKGDIGFVGRQRNGFLTNN